MDESLFQRLALHRPEAIVQLSLQYRMNSAIMHISNALVYEGKLQCGNDKIANSTLHVPQWNQMQEVSDERVLQFVRILTSGENPFIIPSSGFSHSYWSRASMN